MYVYYSILHQNQLHRSKNILEATKYGWIGKISLAMAYQDVYNYNVQYGLIVGHQLYQDRNSQGRENNFSV